MPTFEAVILKYVGKGEKSGWTYVDIPPDVLARLKRKNKKSFRIKGSIDKARFDKLNTYPVGNGEMIIAINATLRKKLGKKEGAMVKIVFEVDESAPLISEELMNCLQDEKPALKQFLSQLPSHQNYFHKYVIEAKTAETQAARIVNTINAMLKKQDFGEMIRSLKKK